MPTPSSPETYPLNGRFLSGYAPFGEPMTRPIVTLQLAPRHEVVVGESSLLPFHFLRTGDRLGRAVVKIRRADGACGTGFLVAADVLLTNHHVLPDAATAARAVVVADYEAPAPGTPAAAAIRHVEVTLKPDRLFVTEVDLDFTFCGVAGLEGREAIVLDRSLSGIGPWEVVNIIQHPRGRPKEVALRNNQVVKADGVVLHYVCDTEPGSSGSPVFDNGWQLVALHHASVTAERSSKKAGLSPQYLNEGVRLAALALWLESDGPESDDDEALERIRDLFRGADPRAGLFGAIGRSPRGRSSAEMVANPSDRGGEVLDVAYWDLRALRGRPMESLHDLGPIVDALGMDIWLFANASPALARALAEHLETWFHRPYAVVPGAGPISVLAQTHRALTVVRGEIDGLDSITARIRDDAGRESAILVVPGIGDASGRVAAMREAGCADVLAIGPQSADPAEDLRPSGLETWSASGAGDGLVLTRSAESQVLRAFASPNLNSPDGTIRIARGRDLIDTAKRVAGRAPVAARLVLGNGVGGA
jgi:Trypsin-like peptidase domain